ncbi:chloroplast processing peptidase-like isoform X2 [Daucus carota subsp. sativus]|uniref:chloroplast processing peptidase-like isoform X2 n=1 Tax=Daucus carota subsp. sativus TaxID=79200 RepID=UPI0007EF6752|nr:PREDICTED: chloroplast processing peptidase-like isoform X2 [Daucus carota subsp. sativus]
MSFLRPSALYQLLITFNSLKWMPCMFFGYPNFQGIIRLVIMFLLWSTFTEMCHISSSSMSPTLRVGDRIFVEKASYFFRRPALHDIVIFRAHLNQPSFREGDMLIKRIVARAGDLIEVHDGRLYVNGLAMKEDFVTEKPKYAIHPTGFASYKKCCGKMCNALLQKTSHLICFGDKNYGNTDPI